MALSLESYLPHLEWISAQQTQMCALVKTWAEINSHSNNLIGLERMRKALHQEFSHLPGQLEDIVLEPALKVNAQGDLVQQPLGKALLMQKAGDDPAGVLLCGHMDTVYPVDSAFQQCQQLNGHTLQGPGVADLKGGLVVLLTALKAFERSPYANKLGWSVWIGPDEEIGSPGSTPHLQRLAKQHRIGLVFEPSLPDGACVKARKGSLVYSLIARGRAAHVGRDFNLGRNAIQMLLPIMQALSTLTNPSQGIVLNLGTIVGGQAVNVVPDLAILRFGLRASSSELMRETQCAIEDIVRHHQPDRNDGSLTLVQETYRPPKPFDGPTAQLTEEITACAELLRLPLEWKETGGVCDGNTLAAAGLPNIDTLGPVGGHLHSSQEYVLLDSLVQRAQLAALILMKLASKQFGRK